VAVDAVARALHAHAVPATVLRAARLAWLGLGFRARARVRVRIRVRGYVGPGSAPGLVRARVRVRVRVRGGYMSVRAARLLAGLAGGVLLAEARVHLGRGRGSG